MADLVTTSENEIIDALERQIETARFLREECRGRLQECQVLVRELRAQLQAYEAAYDVVKETRSKLVRD